MGKTLFRADEGAATETLTPKSAGPRPLMVDHYWQHLQTTTNRHGRPYDAATIKSYMRCVRELAKWLDAQSIPGDLTPACAPSVLNDFFRSYLTGHSLNGTALMHRSLRPLFNWLERETDTPSPYRSRDLVSYKPRRHKPKVLSHGFITELLGSLDKSFTGTRDEAIIRLLLEGLRVGELLAIEIGQVPSMDHRVIRVVPRKGERQYAEGSGRRIHLTEATVRALHRYVRARATHPLASSVLRDSLWLGKGSIVPLTYDGVRQMLVRRSGRLGYDAAATAHMFRHTFTSDALDAGMPLNDLVTHMGWASFEMLKIYGVDQAEVRAIRSKERMPDLYG